LAQPFLALLGGHTCPIDVFAFLRQGTRRSWEETSAVTVGISTESFIAAVGIQTSKLLANLLQQASSSLLETLVIVLDTILAPATIRGITIIRTLQHSGNGFAITSAFPILRLADIHLFALGLVFHNHTGAFFLASTRCRIAEFVDAVHRRAGDAVEQADAITLACRTLPRLQTRRCLCRWLATIAIDAIAQVRITIYDTRNDDTVSGTSSAIASASFRRWTLVKDGLLGRHRCRG